MGEVRFFRVSGEIIEHRLGDCSLNGCLSSVSIYITRMVDDSSIRGPFPKCIPQNHPLVLGPVAVDSRTPESLKKIHLQFLLCDVLRGRCSVVPAQCRGCRLTGAVVPK